MTNGLVAARDRIQTLDAFRAIAIVAVLLFHYLYRYTLPTNDTDLYGYQYSYSFVKYGYLGVEFFFIISGFVIYMTLDRCNSAVQFFVRRFARLYPAYLVAMTLTFLLVNAIGPTEFHRSFKEWLVGLSMQSTHFGVAWVDGVYWSLLVEIKFYAWAGLLYLLSKQNFDLLWCAFAVVATAIGLVSEDLGNLLFVSQYIPFFTFGLYFYRQYSNGKQRLQMLLATGILCYLVAWRSADPVVHIAVAVMLAVFYAFSRGKLGWLATAPLLFLGDISYSLYLVHQRIGVSLIRIVRREFGLPDLIAAFLAFGCSVLIAYCITRWVEHTWKRRITRFAEETIMPRMVAYRWYQWLRYPVQKLGHSSFDHAQQSSRT
jgi:peptidoglycan/LPS O-acetylase OafA/YrhL